MGEGGWLVWCGAELTPVTCLIGVWQAARSATLKQYRTLTCPREWMRQVSQGYDSLPAVPREKAEDKKVLY